MVVPQKLPLRPLPPARAWGLPTSPDLIGLPGHLLWPRCRCLMQPPPPPAKSLPPPMPQAGTARRRRQCLISCRRRRRPPPHARWRPQERQGLAATLLQGRRRGGRRAPAAWPPAASAPLPASGRPPPRTRPAAGTGTSIGAQNPWLCTSLLCAGSSVPTFNVGLRTCLGLPVKHGFLGRSRRGHSEGRSAFSTALVQTWPDTTGSRAISPTSACSVAWSAAIAASCAVDRPLHVN